ncbi:MAG: hypothetical protein OXI64_02750, partial [Defluviicoccus sp.]|nr:hypothetical protein [Defluviicoccus sp.]
VYQWDVCIEVLMWEGYYGLEGDYRERIIDSLGSVGDMVPGDIDLGYHCATAARRTSTWCNRRISGCASRFPTE